MSTVTPELHFHTLHGVFHENWPTPPRVGEYVRVATDEHGAEKAERVLQVVWASDAVMVIARCEPL